MTYRTIRTDERSGVLNLELNRPEVHNAFNDEMIAEMIDLFGRLNDRDDLRAILLCGTGRNFCAGADLNWMTRMIEYTHEENVRDSSALAKMYAVMNESPVPIVGRIQGAAIGGGTGLVSVCDVAICEERSKFGLSEVKLGIIPAVISPYVIAKIGESHARALFMTGERFDASRARTIGLVHRVAKDETELDMFVEETIAQLKTSGPNAVRACKKVIFEVLKRDREDAIPYTIETISNLRVKPEGQGGMTAFLRKEKAPWIVE